MVTVSAGAAPHRAAGCPAPKPLPASVKRPPASSSPTQLANFLLALPQRKPCDVNLFTSTYVIGDTRIAGAYPEGRPMQPLPSATPTEANVRAELVAFLGSSPGKAATLSLFDRSDVKTKLPDPRLRASLAALRGTVAEPVIAYFLEATYARAPQFGGVPGVYVGFAAGGPGSRYITFNRRYESEHLGLLSAIFAHEVLHHDSPNSATEEVMLHALTAVVHMQLLVRYPRLATSGTELSRSMNDLSLVFANSRTRGSSKSAIFAPGGMGTAPDSDKSQRDLAGHSKDFLGGQPVRPTDNTPAPPVLATVLRKLLASGVALPKPLTYSKKTAELFSRMNDTWLSPVDRLRVSVLLGLVSVEEIVAYTGLTRAKAISTFRLAPILAAQR